MTHPTSCSCYNCTQKRKTMTNEPLNCCRKCSVNRPRDVIEGVFEIDCIFCPCHLSPASDEIKLCPSCNTMKHFDGDRCARCSAPNEQRSWESIERKKFEKWWNEKEIYKFSHPENWTADYLIQQISAAQEEAYVEGQKHAFGVDRERVKEEGRNEERERIAKAIENAEEYMAVKDNDSHRYEIPKSKKNEWETFCEIPSDDERSWDVPEWANRIDGQPVRSFKTIATQIARGSNQ